MGENVLFRPAREVEGCTGWQEAETGLRHLHPAFAHKHGVELRLERVQIQNVRSRIGELGVAQRIGTPIR